MDDWGLECLLAVIQVCCLGVGSVGVMQAGRISKQYEVHLTRESPSVNHAGKINNGQEIRKGGKYEKINIGIDRSHLSRSMQIKAMVEVVRHLFSSRRYQNVVLSCEMEFFYIAEKIANVLHKHIANLHKIVSLNNRSEKPRKSKSQSIKKQGYSEMVSIRLTFDPSNDDRQRAGYEPGKPQSAIKRPISSLFINQCVKRNSRIEVESTLQKINRKREIQQREKAKRQQEQLAKKKAYEENKKRNKYKLISRNCRYEEENRYNTRLNEIKEGKVFQRCIRREPHDNQVKPPRVDQTFIDRSYRTTETRPAERPYNQPNSYTRGQVKTRGRGGDNKRRF